MIALFLRLCGSLLLLWAAGCLVYWALYGRKREQATRRRMEALDIWIRQWERERLALAHVAMQRKKQEARC